VSDEITNKITSFFGVERVGDISWASRINTREVLEEYVRSQDIMMLEGDVLYVPEKGGAVMTHQFDQEIDLTFKEWLGAILKAGKGAKVDFKQLRPHGRPPVELCLGVLAEVWDPKVPLMLNADIFVGPGGSKSVHDPVDPEWFLKLCDGYRNRYNRDALLSLGWVTGGCSDRVGYTDEVVDQMLQAADGPATFPIKACYARSSWERIQRLLEDPQHTLTIWSHGEAISDGLKEWLRRETDPERTFYDLADPSLRPIRLWEG